MKNKQALFSSSSDEWSTPQNIFDLLNDEFNFNLDPCATKGNHKCSKWFEAAENGLLQNWGGTEYSVTHHIAILVIGLLKHFMRVEKITH